MLTLVAGERKCCKNLEELYSEENKIARLKTEKTRNKNEEKKVRFVENEER